MKTIVVLTAAVLTSLSFSASAGFALSVNEGNTDLGAIKELTYGALSKNPPEVLKGVRILPPAGYALSGGAAVEHAAWFHANVNGAGDQLAFARGVVPNVEALKASLDALKGDESALFLVSAVDFNAEQSKDVFWTFTQPGMKDGYSREVLRSAPAYDIRCVGISGTPTALGPRLPRTGGACVAFAGVPLAALNVRVSSKTTDRVVVGYVAVPTGEKLSDAQLRMNTWAPSMASNSVWRVRRVVFLNGVTGEILNEIDVTKAVRQDRTQRSKSTLF